MVLRVSQIRVGHSIRVNLYSRYPRVLEVGYNCEMNDYYSRECSQCQLATYLGLVYVLTKLEFQEFVMTIERSVTSLESVLREGFLVFQLI